ncbi:DUF2829 domain-containing protein [uncultured Flavonifractor sp.]|uniref:DUF2829 domain-containing protein n=1 Tax=uncultured Flavonifractor sp. TaxID=1193534 RepID=UPI002619EDA7|nr:DUF2829 domain-containing protein [uncultured Flavonifractor sp.]
MKTYIGTKIIDAQPAYRVDGKTVQPTDWPVPEGAKTEEGYAVRYPDGYMSWSPKAVFEEAYRPTDNLNFGLAIEAAKKGKKISRAGWNGKGQYVQLATCISYTDPAGAVVNAEHKAVGNQALAFVGTSGVQLGWLASQADMLADDWTIVE